MPRSGKMQYLRSERKMNELSTLVFETIKAQFSGTFNTEGEFEGPNCEYSEILLPRDARNQQFCI